MTALVTQYTNVVPSGTKQRGTRCQLGTTAENDAYTGTAGEITFDTDLENLRIHDGVTAGGVAVGTQGGAYGSLYWRPHEQEATIFQMTLQGSEGGYWDPKSVLRTRPQTAPRPARGVTTEVVGGAGRTNARAVTVGTDGRLTFAGNRTRAMVALATVCLRHGDPAVGNTLGLHLYRNGSPILGADVYADTSVTRGPEAANNGLLGFQPFAITAIVEMKPGDHVQLYVSNQTSAYPVTLESGTFTLHSV